MSATTDTARGPWRPVALALGALLVAFGLSGFLDDSGLLPHHPALIAVAALVVACVVAAAHTLRRLLGPPTTHGS